MEVKKRRLENDLVTLGTGVTVFGIWTFLKFGFALILYDKLISESLSPEQKIILIITTIIMAAIIALMHCYIGLSARSHGLGKRKTVAYIVVGFILAALNIIAIVPEFSTLFTGTEAIGSILISMLIDITSLVILIELNVSAIRFRKINKQFENGGAA